MTSPHQRWSLPLLLAERIITGDHTNHVADLALEVGNRCIPHGKTFWVAEVRSHIRGRRCTISIAKKVHLLGRVSGVYKYSVPCWCIRTAEERISELHRVTSASQYYLPILNAVQTALRWLLSHTNIVPQAPAHDGPGCVEIIRQIAGFSNVESSDLGAAT